MAHSFLSPSAYNKWSVCPAAPCLEELSGIPDTSSLYAEYGTRAHDLAARILNAPNRKEALLSTAEDEVMNRGVRCYVEFVFNTVNMYRRAGSEAYLLVEQAVPIDHVTGEAGAQGTADVIIASVTDRGDAYIDVIDLKFGTGEKVEAKDNGQLQIYALGAMRLLSRAFEPGAWAGVSLTIHQPRLSAMPQSTQRTVNGLAAFHSRTKAAAETALALRGREVQAMDMRNPGQKACRWCKIRETCSEAQKARENDILSNFEVLT